MGVGNTSPLMKIARVKHMDRLVSAGRVKVRLDLLRRLEEMETASAAMLAAWQSVNPDDIDRQWWSDNVLSLLDDHHAAQKRAIDDLTALLIAVDRLDAEENPPLARVPMDD